MSYHQRMPNVGNQDKEDKLARNGLNCGHFQAACLSHACIHSELEVLFSDYGH